MKKLWLLYKLFIGVIILVLLVLGGLYTYSYLSPSIAIENSNSIIIYDRDENPVYYSNNTANWVTLENISQDVINAVVSVEDKNFYSHLGFDYLRIAKAMMINIESGGIVQGASTISQQYVKNLFLDFDKTWNRKVDEALLTMNLEMHYEKDEILEGYLNTIYYGQGNYGIYDASMYYFNKEPNELTLEESIMLVGIPKKPNDFNPVTNYELAKERALVVASTMVSNGFITEERYHNLFVLDLAIHGSREDNSLETIMYYYDAVYNELETIDEIPVSLLDTGGLKIYTSLDMEVQTEMENSIKRNMNDSEELQVASVVIEPDTGAVLALSGGVDYAISQYNRALSSKRQVGSSIKPILYYAALENGMVSSTKFLSEPTTFVFSDTDSYSPINYNEVYGNQEITMAAALSYSDNIYAVKTHLFLGEETLVDTSKRMGIDAELLANPSLALGTSEINMMDFAGAYTILANGGYEKEITFIDRIEDLDGNVLYENDREEKLVLNPNYVFILNEMMTGTYNSAFDDYNSPTVISIASKISREYAVKTGSTGTDFWMVGYNPDVLMLVWNGNDDSSTLKVSQGGVSKNIWVDTVEAYLKDKEANWYQQPENVVGVPLDAISGEPVNDALKTVMYYYVSGSEVGYKKEDYLQ